MRRFLLIDFCKASAIARRSFFFLISSYQAVKTSILVRLLTTTDPRYVTGEDFGSVFFRYQLNWSIERNKSNFLFY